VIHVELAATRPGTTRRIAPVKNTSSGAVFGHPTVRIYRWFLPFLPWQTPCAVSCGAVVQSEGVAFFEVLAEAPIEIRVGTKNARDTDALQSIFTLRHTRQGNENVVYDHSVMSRYETSKSSRKPPTHRFRLSPTLPVTNDPSHDMPLSHTRTQHNTRAELPQKTPPEKHSLFQMFASIWSPAYSNVSGECSGGELGDL